MGKRKLTKIINFLVILITDTNLIYLLLPFKAIIANKIINIYEIIGRAYQILVIYFSKTYIIED